MQSNLAQKGYDIINGIYSKEEIDSILALVASKPLEHSFGVREFLKTHPDIAEKVLSNRLKNLISTIDPHCDKLIKSIYFDKPPTANWIVNWHQDLTINLKGRVEVEGYKNWRVLPERTVVQPTLAMLERIFTI